jgi:hypothetical protein
VNLGKEASFPVADALAAAGVPVLLATACDRAALPDRLASVPWMVKPVTDAEALRFLERLVAASAQPGSLIGRPGPRCRTATGGGCIRPPRNA